MSEEVHRKMLVPVQGHHKLFVAQRIGDDADSAVLFLHGGPGGHSDTALLGCLPQGRQAIAFDQRGCGRSLPKGNLVDNTTQNVVQDIEAIRGTFQIEKFHLVGGSWGAALALLYANQFPDFVERLTVYSPFLGTTREVEYFLTALEHRVPESWEEFVDGINVPSVSEIVSFYHRATSDRNHPSHRQACLRWMNYEISAATNGQEQSLSREYILAGAHLFYSPISLHYFKNSFFFEEGAVLEAARSIKVPVTILHGQEDWVSNPATAVALADALQLSNLIMFPNAGHCGGSEQLDRALLKELTKDG